MIATQIIAASLVLSSVIEAGQTVDAINSVTAGDNDSDSEYGNFECQVYQTWVGNQCIRGRDKVMALAIGGNNQAKCTVAIADARSTLDNIGSERPYKTDSKTLLSYLKSAAADGITQCELTLGKLYWNGLLVPQNWKLAVQWMQRAAQKGDPESQSGLGEAYFTGRGVTRDLVRAYFWFSLAAANQQYYAKLRDSVSQQMTKDQILEAQRLSSSWKPSNSTK